MRGCPWGIFHTPLWLPGKKKVIITLGPSGVSVIWGAGSHRGGGAVASQRHTLARTPLAAVGVSGAAVAVCVLLTPLSVSICSQRDSMRQHDNRETISARAERDHEALMRSI